MDFNNHLFRASAVKNLHVKPRSKSELLSETAKTYLLEEYIRVVYGRDKEVTSKFMDKGTLCETDGLRLLKSVTGKAFFKNSETLQNTYVCGTPDVWKKGDFILDVKNSWDLWTFSAVTYDKAAKNYLHQLNTYMWLTGERKAHLVYTLVNTPDEIVQKELYRAVWGNDALDPESPEVQELMRNYRFDDIPENKRIKIYTFEYDPSLTEQTIVMAMTGRDFMKSLHEAKLPIDIL